MQGSPRHAIESSGLAGRLRNQRQPSSLAKCPQARFSTLRCGHQLSEADDIEYPPEIVGERGQAELGANLRQASHQKRTLVHPLLDRAKRMLDRLTTDAQDVRATGDAGLHPVEDGFVFETRYRAEAIPRASRTDRAISAGLAVGVVDLLERAQDG